MVLAQGGMPVPAPARVQRRGLLQQAPTLPVNGDRWLGGITVEWESCEWGAPRPIVCDEAAADLDAKPEGTPGTPVLWSPYYALGVDTCSVMDRGRDRAAQARANLLATRSAQVEAEVMSGAASLQTTGDNVNPFLADGNATLVSGTATPWLLALAQLDHELTVCLGGSQGMLHVTPYTANLWLASGALRYDGQRLLTVSDNIVVSGAGYNGATPGDPPTAPSDIAAAAYGYGSPLVYVALGSEDRIAETEAQEVDRATNSQTTRVEQPAVAVWDTNCCVLALNIDHTTDT